MAHLKNASSERFCKAQGPPYYNITRAANIF